MADTDSQRQTYRLSSRLARPARPSKGQQRVCLHSSLLDRWTGPDHQDFNLPTWPACDSSQTKPGQPRQSRHAATWPPNQTLQHWLGQDKARPGPPGSRQPQDRTLLAWQGRKGQASTKPRSRTRTDIETARQTIDNINFTLNCWHNANNRHGRVPRQRKPQASRKKPDKSPYLAYQSRQSTLTS